MVPTAEGDAGEVEDVVAALAGEGGEGGGGVGVWVCGGMGVEEREEVFGEEDAGMEEGGEGIEECAGWAATGWALPEPARGNVGGCRVLVDEAADGLLDVGGDVVGKVFEVGAPEWVGEAAAVEGAGVEVACGVDDGDILAEAATEAVVVADVELAELDEVAEDVLVAAEELGGFVEGEAGEGDVDGAGEEAEEGGGEVNGVVGFGGTRDADLVAEAEVVHRAACAGRRGFGGRGWAGGRGAGR